MIVHIFVYIFVAFSNPVSSSAANAKSPKVDAIDDLQSANGKTAICKLDGKKWILENLGETTKEIDIKAEQVRKNDLTKNITNIQTGVLSDFKSNTENIFSASVCF